MGSELSSEGQTFSKGYLQALSEVWDVICIPFHLPYILPGPIVNSHQTHKVHIISRWGNGGLKCIWALESEESSFIHSFNKYLTLHSEGKVWGYNSEHKAIPQAAHRTVVCIHLVSLCGLGQVSDLFWFPVSTSDKWDYDTFEGFHKDEVDLNEMIYVLSPGSSTELTDTSQVWLWWIPVMNSHGDQAGLVFHRICIRWGKPQ